MIELKNVSKIYSKASHKSVDNVSMTVCEGELLVLLGSSGCGKTTTLKMINRLVELSSGSIHIDGRDITTIAPVDLRRSIGYVFQGIGLFPHLTIEQNITVVLKLLKNPFDVCQKRAAELLELIDLHPSDFARRYPDELSGGQQQRVGVARALATDPNYLLMDEPFGALDAINRESLQTEVLRIKQQLGKTIIFVTHDIFEGIRLADRIAIMHQGRIEQLDTPDNIMKNPASSFVKELFDTPNKQCSYIAQAAHDV